MSLLAVSGAGGAGLQTPSRGGTIVVGPVAEPSCLNPVVLACQGNAFFWITQSVLLPAFATAPDFTARSKLVSGVAFTRKPPFTLTHSIRAEARSSDGVPVTARDFVFTHDAILEHVPPGNLGPHADVASIHAVDAKTVRVVMRARRSDWRTLFGSILPRHALAGEELGEAWSEGIANPRTGRPIGERPLPRGAVAARRAAHACPQLPLLGFPSRLPRSNRHPLLSRVRPTNPRRGPRRRAEERLRLHPLPGYVDRPRPSEDLGGARARCSLDGLGPWRLTRRAGREPCSPTKLVRRALMYGIDRVAIVKQLFGEIDPKYPPSDNALVLNTSRSYVPNWKRYRYRPALSRRLLEQAGCRRGADGVYVCDGTRLSLRFMTIAGVTVRERYLELMQSQLRRAGFEIETVFVPFQTLVAQILPSGDFDGVGFAWFVPVDALGKSVFGCGGGQNYTGYCQRLVSRDLDQAERILAAEQRGRALNRADRQMAKDVPAIPLFQIPFVSAYREELRNVEGGPFQRPLECGDLVARALA